MALMEVQKSYGSINWAAPRTLGTTSADAVVYLFYFWEPLNYDMSKLDGNIIFRLDRVWPPYEYAMKFCCYA